MYNFEYFIAKRYLKSQNKNNFVYVITNFATYGIALGVSVMIITMALMNGFRYEIKKNLFSATAHFTIASLDKNIKNTNSIVNSLNNHKLIKSASPVCINHCLLKTLKNDIPPLPMVIKAIDPALTHGTSTIFDSLKPLSIQQLRRNEIIIGNDLANSLNVKIGDKLVCAFLNTNEKLAIIQPKLVTFKIFGIFQSHINEYDKHWAFIHLEDSMKLSNSNEAEMIEVMVKDVDQIASTKLDILNFVNQDSTTNFFIQDIIESNKALFSALKVEKWIFLTIFSFIVIISAFNIISALIILITEKRKDLGVLLALGATPKQIQNLFELQGIYISTIGTILGLIVSIPFCLLANRYQWIKLPETVYDFITYMPFKLCTSDLLIIGLFPLLISWIASKYPAKHAANLNPVISLRSE